MLSFRHNRLSIYEDIHVHKGNMGFRKLKLHNYTTKLLSLFKVYLYSALWISFLLRGKHLDGEH